MPAPDLPPPPEHKIERPLAVHLCPRMVDPAAMAGDVVIVVDALRASVTIAAALASGAAAVAPAMTVEEARAKAVHFGSHASVLGGERGGKLIENFHLDNSPARYTPTAVGGKTVVFTTTNGTAAMLHAREARRILVGSLANLSAVCTAVASESRTVHILCAGTRDDVTLDDCLAAGAMVERLLTAGRQLVAEDAALLCLNAWRLACREGVETAMISSRGGRNLSRLGHQSDVALCARTDTYPVVPEFDVRAGLVRASSGLV